MTESCVPKTYQELFQWLLVWFGVFALYFSGSESVLDVQGLMVEPVPLFGVGVVGDDSGAQVGSPAVLALLFTVGSAPSAVPGGVNVGSGGAAHLKHAPDTRMVNGIQDNQELKHQGKTKT